MASGNGAEESGGEPAADPTDGPRDGSAEQPTEEPAGELIEPPIEEPAGELIEEPAGGPAGDSTGAEDDPADPAPAAGEDGPRTYRRKTGVKYWPV